MDEHHTPTAFLLKPFSAKAAGDEKPATYRAVQRAVRHLPFDKAHCRCHMYGGQRLTTRNLRVRLVKAIEETLAERAG